MAQVHKTVLVEYSASHMRDLVEDVLAYPQFLPWCGGSAAIEFGAECLAHGVGDTGTPTVCQFAGHGMNLQVLDVHAHGLKG
jgi:hypothetical protein